jgi:hypothetical protein
MEKIIFYKKKDILSFFSDKIEDNIKKIINKGFKTEFDKNLDFLFNADLSCFAYDTSAKKIIGYCYGNIDNNIFHISGFVTDPSFFQKYISVDLLTFAIKLANRSFISYHTQNPLAYLLVDRLGAIQYPSPNAEQKPYSIDKILTKKIKNSTDHFLIKKSVILNKYDDCLYKKIPQSKDSIINNWFNEQLVVKKGKTRHAFFIIADVNFVLK